MAGSRELIEKKVAWVSIWSNIVLTVAKILIGLFALSEALVADGIHSAADLFASIVVLLVIGIANKPADEQHPYGHGKAEVIISAVVGVILFLVSIYIIYEAILSFFSVPKEVPKWIAFFVAIFSYASKHLLYRYSFTIAQSQQSKAIEAIAFDHKADISASLAAAAGVLLTILGSTYDIHILLYADAAASLIVAVLIFRIAWEMLAEAYQILMESNVNEEQMKRFEEIIRSFEEVRRIDRLRAREHGHYIIIDLRISIDYFKTIEEGHELGRRIKLKIQEEYDHVQEVLIHLNPYHP